MSMPRFAVAMLIATLPAARSASAAPEMPKPGPEHARLAELAGTWECTAKTSYGLEFKGVSTSKMELGGFWLITEFKAELPGFAFQGRGIDGYCPIKKKYFSVWTDSVNPSPTVLEGTADADGKVVTMTGEGPGQDGKMNKLRTVTKFVDKDTFTWSMFGPGPDGKEAEMLTITYKRKK